MENSYSKMGIILLFSIVLLGGGIYSVVKPEQTFSKFENRYLAEQPKWNKEEFLSGDWQMDYENYLNDQFPMRDRWVDIKTWTDRVMLKQDSGDVFYGKDDYLIEKYAEADFDETMVEENIAFLTEFIKEMQQRYGEEHILAMFVPGKGNAMPDKLPSFATAYNEQQTVNRITQQVGEQTVLDVTGALQQHQQEYIYYRTDHHWTTLGAWYAYEQWAEKLGETPIKKEKCEIEAVTDDFYGTTYFKVHTKVPADTIELYHTPAEKQMKLRYNLSEKKDSIYDREKLKEQDQYQIFFGGNQPIVEMEMEKKGKGTLLLLKDSYANCFVPFLANHYSKIIMMDIRYLNSSIYQFLAMYEDEITDVMTMYNVEKFLQEKNMWYLSKDI
jgi:hypothetical protein